MKLGPEHAESILLLCCNTWDVPLSDLYGKGRMTHETHARRAVAYICRQSTELSYPEIAHLMHVKGHSGVIAQFRAAEHMVQTGETTSIVVDGDPCTVPFEDAVNGVTAYVWAHAIWNTADDGFPVPDDALPEKVRLNLYLSGNQADKFRRWWRTRK